MVQTTTTSQEKVIKDENNQKKPCVYHFKDGSCYRKNCHDAHRWEDVAGCKYPKCANTKCVFVHAGETGESFSKRLKQDQHQQQQPQEMQREQEPRKPRVFQSKYHNWNGNSRQVQETQVARTDETPASSAKHQANNKKIVDFKEEEKFWKKMFSGYRIKVIKI